ncbi:hypothetical protein CJF30_00006436 [Rutstroemia sp. NJR-2017a BBW]|nr:hypothetical protein CJF30_00006436 [Rutstroemia sp. NJR-2017a BBW]
MASPGRIPKRKSSTDRPISPPPVRRKVQSSTTCEFAIVIWGNRKADILAANAIASFFTPKSQKPPQKISWQERALDDDTPSTLLVGKYEPSKDSAISEPASQDTKRNKIAAFDFVSDDTFIPFRVVVLSNQAGISLKTDPKTPKAQRSRLGEFKTKAAAVLSQLDIPISIYAATEKDIYRKPRTGMWKELLEDYNIHQPADLNLQDSIFVGDAGGRHASVGHPKDFSCSDRLVLCRLLTSASNFAENVGIKFYTPEEYFLHEAPRPFTRTFEPGDYIPEGTAGERQSYD